METTKPKDIYPVFKERYPIRSGFYSGHTLQPVAQLGDDKFECRVLHNESGFVSFVDSFNPSKKIKEIAIVKLTVAEFNKWINGD